MRSLFKIRATCRYWWTQLVKMSRNVAGSHVAIVLQSFEVPALCSGFTQDASHYQRHMSQHSSAQRRSQLFTLLTRLFLDPERLEQSLVAAKQGQLDAAIHPDLGTCNSGA